MNVNALVFGFYILFIFLIIGAFIIPFWILIFKVLKRLIKYLDYKISDYEEGKF